MKIDVFELFLIKSIVNAENGVFLTLIFVRFPYRNMVKIEVFDTFLRKSIVMVDFGPYFLVKFPYRNMVKIEGFHTFSKEKYRDSRKQGIFDPYF